GYRRVGVRGQLVRVALRCGDHLGFRGKGPFDELDGRITVRSVGDEAQAADLVTGAFGGRVDGEREALQRELHAVVHELDGDGYLTATGELAGCRAGAGVLGDVLVDAAEDLEGLLLAEDLHQRGDDGVGG